MTDDSISIDLFKVAGGFGLFLYSLRSLTVVLQRSLTRRLRGALLATLSSPWRCFVLGFFATALVQASSVTVMASMGMVYSTLITLEQGFFLVLGATLGTTLKLWFVGAEILKAGPILVCLGSVLLLFARRAHRRELLEALMAIGFALWGMLLLKEGLELVHNRPEVQMWLVGHPGDRLYHQFVGIILGTAMAAILQSSSTVVFLTISLASTGLLQFPQAAAVVLGANVGTTLVPLLASLEHGRVMHRLALAYLIIKVVGVGITLFFFPQFLLTVTACLPSHWGVGLRLAAVHTGFNLINVIWWSIFSGLTLRMVERMLPLSSEGNGSSLAPVVRRILSRSAGRSLQEAHRQMARLTLSVKSLLDRCGAILRGEPASAGLFEARILEHQEFESLKESTYELLAQSGRQNSADQEEIRLMVRQLSYFEELFYQAWRLREELEHGLSRDGLELPDGLKEGLGRFQRAVDEHWLKILFPTQAPLASQDSLNLLNSLEDQYFQHLGQGAAGEWATSIWAFDVLNGIREVLQRLHRGVEWASLPESAPGEKQKGPPSTDVEPAGEKVEKSAEQVVGGLGAQE